MAEHRIKRAIKRSGRTMRWLAAQLGVSPTYISDIACGYRIPAEHVQAALASLLDTEVAALWPPERKR